MLNLIWFFSPNFVFQSCQAPPYCNYTFLYHSILEALRYVLIYNRLHLSKTLPHEVIIENKLVQFVFDIRKRIGIIRIIIL